MGANPRENAALTPGTWAYLYFRLTRAEEDAGPAGQALVYSRKALELCQEWSRTDRGVNARITLRGAYSNLAGAQMRAGDLYGARETYETVLRTAKDALRQPDATVYERSMLSASHLNLSSLLGSPEDLNLNDRAGAIPHARIAVEIAESIAATDREDFRARDDLAGAYRNLGSILLEDRPEEALAAYQKAAEISEALSQGNPSNTKFRHDVAFSRMETGDSLHRLGRNREALQNLFPALETMRSLAAASPDEISLAGDLGRIHRNIGNSLLATGDEKGAYENYREALAAAGRLIDRAPASLYFQRQQADSFESLGRYYTRLARRRPEFKHQARAWLQRSLAMWRDWTKRNIATPFAGIRERQVASLLGSIDQL